MSSAPPTARTRAIRRAAPRLSARARQAMAAERRPHHEARAVELHGQVVTIYLLTRTALAATMSSYEAYPSVGHCPGRGTPAPPVLDARTNRDRLRRFFQIRWSRDCAAWRLGTRLLRRGGGVGPPAWECVARGTAGRRALPAARIAARVRVRQMVAVLFAEPPPVVASPPGRDAELLGMLSYMNCPN